MKKTSIHTPVGTASNGLKDLLMETSITTDIAKAYPAFERIFLQLQRDLSVKKDADETVNILKGLSHINDQLLLFRKEGMADINAEKA